MGIEGFFKTLEKRIDIQSGITIKYKSPANINEFFIDFNSIVHSCSTRINNELGYILACLIYDVDIRDDQLFKDYSAFWNFDPNISFKSSNKMELKVSNDLNEILGTMNGKRYMLIQYINHFTPELIHNHVIVVVSDFVEKLMIDNIQKNSLQKVYIALDGIPNMGKMIEQKQRKYMDQIISGLNRKIYKKYEPNLSIERKLFEQLKITFDKGLIVPWSEFMEMMESRLESKEWRTQLNHHFPNLQQIICSSIKIPGEGEMKIMEEAIKDLKNGFNGSMMIYSPDADVVVLTVVLKNLNTFINGSTNNKFYVLHLNQEDQTNTLVDIDLFSNYITKLMINNNLENPNPQIVFKVMNDFVMIVSVFGNDFLPKISSINVKTDFTQILTLYHHMYNKEKKELKQIVVDPIKPNEIFTINYDNLLLYLQYIANIEDDLIKQKYIDENYNTHLIKRIFFKHYDPTDIYQQINQLIVQYIGEFEKFVQFVKSQVINDKNINMIIENVTKQKPFINHLLIMRGGLEYIPNNPNQVKNELRHICNKIIHQKNDHIDPMQGIKRGKKQIDQHQIDKYLENPVIHLINMMELSNNLKKNTNKLTEYDMDILRLNWKVAPYDEMMGSVLSRLDENFGNVDQPFESYQAVDRVYYYSSYLHVDPNNVMDSDHLDKILREYLFGSIWTFDFYFNKNNSIDNMEKVSTWFYPFHRSPLIGEIVSCLKKDIANNITNYMNRIELEMVDRKDFLSVTDHMLYTMPKNKILKIKSNIHDEYDSSLFDDLELFPDIDWYVKKIWKNKPDQQVIDCRRIVFNSKCILNKINNYSFEEFFKRIKKHKKNMIGGVNRSLCSIDCKESFEAVFPKTGSTDSLQSFDAVLGKTASTYEKNRMMYKRLFANSKN